MELYSQALKLAKSRNMQLLSKEEQSQKRCESLNSFAGNLNAADGFDCPACLNRGYIYTVGEGGEIVTKACEKCSTIRKTLQLLRQSGAENCRFENYIVTDEWQKRILDTVISFTIYGGDKWLYIGGQNGAGKTHLCSAALINRVHEQQKDALIFHWIDDAKKFKKFSDDEIVENELETFKRVPMLYIDDLFQANGIAGVTNADIKLALNIIDYRYRNNLVTIISSEMSIDDIIRISEALGGRIKQRAKEYAIQISKDKNKDIRLKE